MKYTNETFCALAAAVAQLAPEAAEAGILIDTDSMSGARFRQSAGLYTIEFSQKEPVSGTFFADAAALCGPQFTPEAVFQACDSMKAPFKRYFRRDKELDEPLPGLAAGCGKLDALYEQSYAPHLEHLAETLCSRGDGDVPVILIGRTAAFFPAEYTVRRLLISTPLSPIVDGLITGPALAVPADELIETGRRLLAEQEQAKKRIHHTVMLQFKQLKGGKLTDHLHTLAEKDTALDALQQPIYSESVFISAQDPIILFADSTPYPVHLPRNLFALRTGGSRHPNPKTQAFAFPDTITKARFALGMADGAPVLLVSTDHGSAQVALDKKIYSEG